LKRLAFIAAVAAVLTGVSAMSGSAASFVDSTPCPASGPLLVCPAGQVGQPYYNGSALQLMARGGCDLYRWEIVNGSLPPGLTMSSDGKVSGVPTAATETIPWVIVHDLLPSEGGYSWCIGDNHSERQFVFRVGPGLSIQDQSVPAGTIGQPYSKQLTVWSVTNLNPVQGGPAEATWSIASGSLPAGVNFSSSGLLSGAPTSEGSYTFVVGAAGGGNATDTETETLVVRQPVTLTTAFGAAKAEVGMLFSSQQSAAGGSGTYTWSVSKGALPAGVTLANDGTISGAPTLAGRYAFTLTVTDNESRAKSVDVTLVVKAKLAFKTLKLKNATAGVAYRSKIVMTGGVAPLTWTATGKVPKGFKLGKTGLLFGTPTKATKAGTYRITVTVIDSLGAVAKKTLTLVVK
jgi:large repetitive protein